MATGKLTPRQRKRQRKRQGRKEHSHDGLPVILEGGRLKRAPCPRCQPPPSFMPFIGGSGGQA